VAFLSVMHRHSLVCFTDVQHCYTMPASRSVIDRPVARNLLLGGKLGQWGHINFRQPQRASVADLAGGGKTGQLGGGRATHGYGPGYRPPKTRQNLAGFQNPTPLRDLRHTQSRYTIDLLLIEVNSTNESCIHVYVGFR
jgi:hypothetical protein